MKAYKFRPATDLYRLEQMIIQGSLWCADWSDLNDPMEGMYLMPSDVRSDAVAAIRDTLRNTKLEFAICSLSRTWQSVLLWAHYADSFKGMALGVDLNDLRDTVEVRDVVYESSDLTFDVLSNLEWEEKAKAILSRKLPEWRYEQEVRLFRRGVGKVRCPIKTVTLGHRVSRTVKLGICDLAADHNVAVYELRVAHDGLHRQAIEAPLRR